MPKPKECPKCGAGIRAEGVGWVTFDCGSLRDTERNKIDLITETCKDRQIAKLEARILKLEKAAEAAKPFADQERIPRGQEWAMRSTQLKDALAELEAPDA